MAIDPTLDISTPLQRVLDRLPNARPCGLGYVASCPNTAGHSHGDKHPSLTISQGADGRALLCCQRRCPTPAVVAALGLTMADLFAEKGIRPLRLVHQKGRPREVAAYPYYDAEGVELYQAVRYEPKAFRQRRPDGNGGYIWNMTGVPYVLYRLPAILRAALDTPIYIVEGEKDSEALANWGLVATTNVGGAEKWRPEYNESLRDRHIVILPDNDTAGARHADQVVGHLRGIAASIRRLELPGLPPKGDASQWITDGGDREQLETLVANSSYLHSSPEESDGNIADTLPEFPLDVFPGDVQRYLATGAEALGVPVDMIATPLLVFAGATLGNQHSIELKPGFQQGPTLYAAVVAPPGSAKSPAIALARHPLDVLQREAYEDFKERLAAYETEAQQWQDAKKGERGEKPERPTLEHFFTTDATMEAAARMMAESPGVALYQDELVGWVKSCDAYRGGRGGDRQRWLSQWAGEPLKIDRRGSDPLFVPHPCMPVIGGIQPELLPELADEAGRRDGFIERLLWSAAPAPPAEWSMAEVSDTDKALMVQLFGQLRHSTADRPVKLSTDARLAWATWYNENARLTAESNGIAQGIYAKLPNQAARLALILHSLHHPQTPAATLVSGSTMADAIALAEYFRVHAQAVLPHFQATTAPRSAGLVARVRRILERSGGEWLPRTTLHRRLGGRTGTEALSDALQELAAAGLAEGQTENTGHRPSEQWRWGASTAANPSTTSAKNEDMKNCGPAAWPAASDGIPLGKATIDRSRLQEGLDSGLTRDAAMDAARVSLEGSADEACQQCGQPRTYAHMHKCPPAAWPAADDVPLSTDPTAEQRENGKSQDDGIPRCARGHPLLMYDDQRTGHCSRCGADGLL